MHRKTTIKRNSNSLSSAYLLVFFFIENSHLLFILHLRIEEKQLKTLLFRLNKSSREIL